METIKEFVKTHFKKIIIGVVLFVITFGGYGLYKVFKGNEESE